MKRQILPSLFLCLALLGTADTAVLTWAHLGDPGVCGRGMGCEAVLSSPYARVLGIPLSLVGMGFFLAAGRLAWGLRRPSSRDSGLASIFYLSLAGSAVSAYLVYLQAAVIKAWCAWCLGSAGLVFTMLLLSLGFRLISPHAQDRPLTWPRLKRRARQALTAGLLPVLAYLAAAHHLDRPAGAGETADPSAVVGRIEGRTVTLGEIDMELGEELYRMDMMRYDMRERWFERRLLQREAGARGVKIWELMRDCHKSIGEISHREVEDYFESHRGIYPPDAKLSAHATRILNELKRRKRADAWEGYLEDLKKKYGAEWRIPRPSVVLAEADRTGGPVRGAADAPITVTIFTDFACPHCRWAHAGLKDLVEESPDVRVVFRHRPPDPDKKAMLAAQAAAAAEAQGRFWEYAEMLFANPEWKEAKTDEDSAARIRELAQLAGLDMAAFDETLASGRAKQRVEQDRNAAKRYGIRAAPTIFINGQYAGGGPGSREFDRLLAEVRDRLNGNRDMPGQRHAGAKNTSEPRA